MTTPALTLALTPGDPGGIGPEITLKALAHPSVKRLPCRFALIGSERALSPWSERLKVPLSRVSMNELKQGEWNARYALLAAPMRAPKGLLLAGYQSGWSIDTAARSVLDGAPAGLVTGPISKAHLRAGGFAYDGHTDLLADLCGARKVTMVLANPLARVALVTVHLPLSKVSKALTPRKIEFACLNLVDWLRNAKNIRRPRIGITGLNPHAGESGVLGQEEIRVIAPTIRRLQGRLGARAILVGPIAADTAFTQPAAFDAVLAMYHDQGLGPVKALDFKRTVNLTLGLPMVRTSVDHGTAFDIAGRGIADASSMIAAIHEAFEWVRRLNEKRKRR